MIHKKEKDLAKSAKGGQGASRMEDLLEKLSDYKRSQYGDKYKAGGKFPDLTGDGKVTMADILKGRGVKSGGQRASYEQGGSVDMPLPESIRGDKMFDGARHMGKMKNTLARNADNAYVSGDLRFYSNDDDGFYVVDKDNNTWSVEKWYRNEGDEDQEFALDDYVMKNLDAKRSFKAGGKFEQGGEVKGDGYSIKIAGQYAVGSIKTIPDSGQQYVSMELPDGKVVPVFGDWESYGNPNREGLIEDMDYRIFPLGDGTYSLDTGEMESEMSRDDSRKVAMEAQGGQGASRMEDLMEKLSDYKGMGQSPNGRMRPYKRQ